MRSALLNSMTFLDTPAESRKAWASKPRFCLDFLLDLTLFGFAITCITLPLLRRFITIMRLKARLMIGGWWRSFGAAYLRDRTPTHPSAVKALVPIRTSVMREFYRNRSAVVSKLTGVGSSFRLHRFSRIKFPIYVGIGPQTTFMQDAILASIDSTRRARDGK